MIKCFEIFVPIARGRRETLAVLAERFVLGQAAQRVVYTEVRYSPHLLVEGHALDAHDDAAAASAAAGGARPLDVGEVVDAVTEGLRRGCEKTGVVVNQILCCIAWRPEWAMSLVDLAKARCDGSQCGVVGIDIAAGEEHFVNPDLHGPHKAALEKAQALGLNITIHAGEVGGPENVIAALDTYGATRVGHGYALVADTDDARAALRRVVSEGVHLECCPTSSYETGGWKTPGLTGADGQAAADWATHPLKALVAAGASCSVSSDDPAVFDTSVQKELRIATDKMGLSSEQLKQCTLAAVSAAFVGPDEKKKLAALVESEWPKPGDALCLQ